MSWDTLRKFEWKGVSGLGLLGFLLALIGPVVISVYFIKAGPLYTAYHPEVAPIDLWDTLPISQKALRDSVMCERGFDVGEDPNNTTDLIRCNMEDSGLNGIRGLGTYTYPVLSLWRYVMAIAARRGVKPVGCSLYRATSLLLTAAASAIIFSLFMVANVPPEEIGWEVRSNIPADVWVALRVDWIMYTITLAALMVADDGKRGDDDICDCFGPCATFPLLLVPPLAFLLTPVGMLQYAYFEDSYWYLIAVPMHYLICAVVYKRKEPYIAALYCATEFTLCTVLFYTLGGADRPPGSFLLPAETWSGMLFFSLMSPALLPVLICCEMVEPSYTGSNLLRLWRSPSPPRVALAATYALCAGMVLYIHVSESDSENLPFVIALFPASICFIDQLLDDPVVDMFAAYVPPAVAAFYSNPRQHLPKVPKWLSLDRSEKPASGQELTESLLDYELPAKVSAPTGGVSSQDPCAGGRQPPITLDVRRAPGEQLGLVTLNIKAMVFESADASRPAGRTGVADYVGLSLTHCDGNPITDLQKQLEGKQDFSLTFGLRNELRVVRSSPKESLGLEYYEPRSNTPGAMLVTGVTSGGACDRAGVAAFIGTCLTHIDGMPCPDTFGLRDLVDGKTDMVLRFREANGQPAPADMPTLMPPQNCEPPTEVSAPTDGEVSSDNFDVVL